MWLGYYLSPTIALQPMAESRTSSHLYQHLSPAQGEIRLVQLKPQRAANQDNKRIHCSLEHVSLNESPTYRALSYAWGDPSYTQSIMLNGAAFRVTENLKVALQHLLHDDKSDLPL
jgi:hypothetical protein